MAHAATHGPRPGGRGPGAMMPGEKAKDFKGTMKKLLGYLGKFLPGIILVLCCAAASTVFSIFGPKILGQATTKLFEGVVAMPECTAMEANYYVREGNYFTEYNREQLQRIFDAAREMGRTDITLKCADETCYREICRVLIDEQEIFSYIPDSNSTISYAQNGKQLSLTFWVTNE